MGKGLVRAFAEQLLLSLLLSYTHVTKDKSDSGSLPSKSTSPTQQQQ
jgi:hypothetical protein